MLQALGYIIRSLKQILAFTSLKQKFAVDKINYIFVFVLIRVGRSKIKRPYPTEYIIVKNILLYIKVKIV